MTRIVCAAIGILASAATAWTPSAGQLSKTALHRRAPHIAAVLKDPIASGREAKAEAARKRFTQAAKAEVFESAKNTRALLASKTFKTGDITCGDTCTLLDIINVLGRFQSSAEWMVRTRFTEPSAKTGKEFDVEAQTGSKERFEMAQRLGCAERLALQQNVPKLPFTNGALAESFGLGARDFADLRINPVAVDVVYDALAESKSGLIDATTIDKRFRAFFKRDGSFNDGKFALGLYKSRMLSGTAFLAKPALYVAVTFQMFMLQTASVSGDMASSMSPPQ